MHGSGALNREHIEECLEKSLGELAVVEAAWLGGSAAFGRADQYSDIDIQALAPHEHAPDIFAHVEAALTRLSPLALHVEVPMPTWHGNPHILYRLAHTSPFLFIDFVVMNQKYLERFRDPDRHGQPIVLFDRTGALKAIPDDTAELRAEIEKELIRIRSMREIHHTLSHKDVLRGKPADAVTGYVLRTLRTLVTVLRIRHDPKRFDFKERYLDVDLPPDVYAEVCDLYRFTPDDLARKRERAEALIRRTLDEIEEHGIDL